MGSTLEEQTARYMIEWTRRYGSPNDVQEWQQKLRDFRTGTSGTAFR